MRDVSDAFLSAVRGSNTPVTIADVWLGSEVIREGALVVGGSLTTDSRDAVEGLLDVTILDDRSRGSELSEIIHSYGCTINVRAGFDLAGEIETVSLGWFDIYDSDAVEEWRWFDWRAENDPVKVSEAVHLKARDYMARVEASKLFAPTQPTPGADAWDAIADLCVDVVSVLDPGLDAKTLPSGAGAIVLDRDRLAGIQAIADLWPAKPVMTDQGQLTLVTPGSGDVVPDFGIRINVDEWRNRTNSENLVNGIEFRGRTEEGLELRGYATEADGPLAWGGPFGRRPGFASSDLMTTQAMVDEAAQTELARRIEERSAVQTVRALWNPAQQVRDRPTLQLPGGKSVASEVLAMTLPLGAPPVGGGPMTTTVRLPLLPPSEV